jgi:hypothetical protein
VAPEGKCRIRQGRTWTASKFKIKTPREMWW